MRISVAEARAHAQSLKLDLLSMETRQSPPPGEMESQDEDSHQMKKSELVKVSFVMILWNIYSFVCLVWEWFT